MKYTTRLRRCQRGQALILVTLSLFTMCGLLGLAVDLGWSYFVKKSAQNAADAAALAAAYQALNVPTGETEPAPSFSGSPNSSAAAYAKQNLFIQGGNQNVTVTSNTGPVTRQDGTIVPSCTGSAGLVGCVEYSVTVRTAEAIPQLFSAILGNTSALSSARATAAIVEARVNGSLITLNRAADNFGPNPTGIDVTPSPITMTSGLIASGGIQSGTVLGPIIALSSVANPNTGSSFQNMVDGPQFLDPMRGYGQPPLPGTALNTYAVIAGDLTGATNGIYQFIGNSNAVNTTQPIAVGSPAVLPSGNYVPGVFGPGCVMGSTCLVDRGAPQLHINGTVTFNAAPFGYYFFYGGLSVAASGKMTMGPGEYVFVGGQNGGGALTTASTAAMDGTGSPGAVAVLTGASGPFTVNLSTSTATGPTDLYPGLLTQINSNVFTVNMAGNNDLSFAPTTLLAPLDQTPVTSLDPTSSALPSNLVPFGGIVMWQDQANSAIVYTTPANTPSNLPGSGYVDIFNCSSHTMASPCTKTLQIPNSPGISVQTQYAMGFDGTIYQPRGAWINVGPGTLGGPMQVITGSVAGNPGSMMSLQPPTIPLRRRVVALIE
jgi:Flp pilus assembly protein TadG